MKFILKGHILTLRVGVIVCLAFVLSAIPLGNFAGSQQVIQKIEALVNDEVISAYDVGQRIGLVLLATGQRIENQNQMKQLRDQVLEDLVNEFLQNQEARQFEVPVQEEEVRQAFARVAEGYNRTPETFAALLAEYGSSPQAMINQIRTEFAWQNLVNGRYGTQAQATDEEIDKVLEDMQANVGRTEYQISEIFLTVNNPAEEARVAAAAQQIRDRIQSFAQFPNIARQFSQSTSAAQGGNVGWVSEGQFSDEIIEAVSKMDLLEISQPIRTAGGFYIVGYTDRRKILTNDPLDELLDLRQIGHFFTEETTEKTALAWFDVAVVETEKVTTCDQFFALAENLDDVSYRDLGEVALKQLNPELRKILEGLETGHPTALLNTPEGFIIFVSCGRRMPVPRLPSPGEIQQQIENRRLVMIARRYLRDLRRDAIIDYK